MDGKMLWKLPVGHLLALLLFLPAVTPQSGIYTVVAPKVIRPNSPYNVGISVDANAPVRVLVRLTSSSASRGASTSTQESLIEPRKSTTITLPVSDLIDGGTYNLSVQGSGGLTFENSTELSYNGKSASIFIQTDKPIYKPGELLRFRILLLDRLLRPNGPGPLVILIKDSQGNVIKQWSDAIVLKGVFSADLQLSPEPNLGDWTLEASFKSQKESQVFTVAQYVLPKFNVELEMPSVATFNSSKIVARIRANYIYGKPVKGEVVLAAYPTIHSTYIQPVFGGISRKTVPINGVVDVELDLTKELGLTDDYQRLVNVEATVTESLTGRAQNTSRTITLHKYPYKLEIIRGQESFKPGLPYTLTIKVASQDDIPVSDPSPSALQVKHGFSYNHDEFRMSSYAIPPTGLVTLTFPSPKNDSLVALGLEATYKDLTEWFPTVQRAISPSNTYLQAKVLTQNIKVNDGIDVEVKSTEPFSSFNYQLLGRGELILSQTVTLRSPETTANFQIIAPHRSAPKGTLIVYIVHEKEVVADSVEFEVLGSVDNFLNISLQTTETEPGSDVEILIKAKPNSLVGLKGIDQSVLVLKEDNDITADSIAKELNSWSFDKEGRGRHRRSLFTPMGSTTAAQVFEDSGVVILTNAVVHQQPPLAWWRMGRGFVHGEGEQMVETGRGFAPQHGQDPEFELKPDSGFQNPTLRKNFQETWLWEQLDGFNGQTSLKRKVPDSITSWIISGFSLDSQFGLGVTEAPSKLRVFRPFFISLNVPYSVVRGEVLGVQVLVHNYMSRDVVAEVTLDNSNDQFRFTQDENEVETKLELYKTEKVTVKANSVESVGFLITPTKLGPIDLNVKAVSSRAGDAISRPLMVKSQGTTLKLNKAALLDLRGGRPQTLNLTARFPPNRVEDSDSVKISVIGDILGPAITNLDKLLELPTGCGEQNMLHFVPDIVVLEYLQTTRQINDNVRDKALKYLEIGYQRELSYKHEDGSFSAFGKADPTGSTFLTAFVARAFMAAKRHIYIQNDVIEKALEWLVSKQERSGGFEEVGKIFDTNIQGGSSDGVALTAYVTLALVEAGADRDLTSSKNARISSATNLALDYLAKKVQGLDDPYALSIIAYAMQVSRHPLRENVFNLLENLAKVSEDGEQKHWARPMTATDEKNPWVKNNAKPLTVETTSYALMTYVQKNLIPDSIPLVRWLLGQRNAQGGFISTQDTVVGLTALARFAGATQSGVTDINIELTHDGGNTQQTQSIQLNRNNAIILQEISLPPSTRSVTINAVGSGIGLIQLSWSYNVNVTGPWPLFNLDPQVDRTSNTNQLHLSVCARSTAEDSNMAVMEVNVPSGFAINKDRLPNLLHYPAIKRFDTEDADSKLIVYFDGLNKTDVCPTVSAYRVFPVAKQAPTYVTVYDYYDNSRRARQFYSPPKAKICDICEEAQCTEECRTARLEAAKNGDEDQTSSAINLNLYPSFIIITITLFFRFLV